MVMFRIFLYIFTLWLGVSTAQPAPAPMPSFRIESKKATGSGCPAGYWVDVSVASNFSSISARYPDFTPAASPQHQLRFAAQNCELSLELDQVPAGYQVSMPSLRGSLHAWFDQSSNWV